MANDWFDELFDAKHRDFFFVYEIVDEDGRKRCRYGRYDLVKETVSADMMIVGNVKSKYINVKDKTTARNLLAREVVLTSYLEIYNVIHVVGNLEAERISAKEIFVEGDLKAREITCYNGKVTVGGNLYCDNIVAEEVVCQGKIMSYNSWKKAGALAPALAYIYACACLFIKSCLESKS